MTWGDPWGAGLWGGDLTSEREYSGTIDPATLDPEGLGGDFTAEFIAVDTDGNETDLGPIAFTIPAAEEPLPVAPAVRFAKKPAHVTRVFVRNGDYERCELIDDINTLTYIARHHAVGTFDLDCGPSYAAEQLLKPGAGIVIVRDDRTVFSGPVRYRKRYRDTQNKRGVTVTGFDDMIWLAGTQIKQEPSNPAPPYSTNATDHETGLASTVMRHYVGANLGSGATPERRLSALSLDADPFLGTTVTWDGRLGQQLLAVLATLARAANLGFRITQDETTNTLRFTVTPTVDRSGQIVFADTLGNIADWSHEHTAADANYLYVGGAGNGTSRTFTEYANSPSILAWGRIEAFLDQRTQTVTAGLDTAGQAQLAQTADKVAVTFTVIPDGFGQWPSDWGLGDLCTAIVDGQRLDDIVREIRVDVSDAGEKITPTIATAGGARATYSWQQALAAERRRIDVLEGA